MRGKRGLIMGIANNRSIAWGIAKACAREGAALALTYQGDALKKRVEPLAAELSAKVVGHCDVTEPATIDGMTRSGSPAANGIAPSFSKPGTEIATSPSTAWAVARCMPGISAYRCSAVCSPLACSGIWRMR